jgi:hypothetical protein
MNDDDDLNELLDDTLQALLLEQISKHVPDDDYVGLLGAGGGAYSVSHRTVHDSRGGLGCHLSMVSDHRRGQWNVR